ncbi:hypothetical protein [Streptomyces sp. NPDC093109]|uniref:hypothetical protein n=1 Tax=Streptomyces sp. NPDC093109 TaxID=3154977 RepID=UPI00344B0D1F
MTTTTTTTPTRDARALLTRTQFADVRATVMDSNPDMTAELAGRIVEQALAFVATAAAFRDARIAPSPVVDEGWHALILHTLLYADLCARLGGDFVHHYPQRPEPSGYLQGVTEDTLATITEAGYTPDLELWQGPDENRITVGSSTWHTPPGGCGPIVLIPKKPKPQPKPKDE